MPQQKTEITDPKLALMGRLALARLRDLPEVQMTLAPVVEQTLASLQVLINHHQTPVEIPPQEE